jgi:RNA polymerase sigma-70 factor (ECF subfamily)
MNAGMDKSGKEVDGDGARDAQQRFVALYQRHVDTVYRVCFTHLRNAADTEDAVQSVFLKLLAKPQGFTDANHEKAWLIRVAANHCKDILRNAWNRRSGLDGVPEPEAPPSEWQPDDTLAVVLSLPENLRVCVYLYYYEGYNAAEIADIIGCAHSTVRNYLSDARKELREKLAGGFDE